VGRLAFSSFSLMFSRVCHSAWCLIQRLKPWVSSPHTRQGLGNLPIFTPAFALEADRWCSVIGPGHNFFTTDADRFVFGVCYPSDDSYSDPTVLALIVIDRTQNSFSLSWSAVSFILSATLASACFSLPSMIGKYSLVISIPMKSKPCKIAALPVEPEPVKGSRTMPWGGGDELD
jgi:hypothetical protein